MAAIADAITGQTVPANGIIPCVADDSAREFRTATCADGLYFRG